MSSTMTMTATTTTTPASSSSSSTSRPDTTTTTTKTTHYKQNQHYTILPHTSLSSSSFSPSNLPPVIVFFSFLSPESYTHTITHKLVATIRKHLPSGTTVSRYHSPNPLGHHSASFAQDLTHAWAVATSLQIDDRVIEGLFHAVQKSKDAVDMQGIKKVFEQDGGIDPLRFDREYAKDGVQREAKFMEEVNRELNVKEVPAIVVGGKYLLKMDAFGEEEDEFRAHKVVDVVKELLDLKA